jgi:hypothetical protein
MPAYELIHDATGHSLYQVASATPEDIEKANANLAASGSLMRYRPAASVLASPQPSARVAQSIPLPA